MDTFLVPVKCRTATVELVTWVLKWRRRRRRRE
jgi:hypothetical protein